MARGPVTLTADEVAAVRAMVIHQDEAIIALNKPSGLSSQGGRIQAHTLDDLLDAFAKSNGNRPRLVHRLDRDTSGVILTARTKPAAAALGKALMDRRVRKTYLAVVTPGAPDPREGVIDTPLRRMEIGREAYMRPTEPDHPDAETASTRYRTLGVVDGAALVELSPHTGRMHQLRAHLASIGRPIVGDARYGGALTLAGEAAGRLLLHAFSIQFKHPDGQAMRLSAPLPPEFVAVLERLGLPVPRPPEPALDRA
jgi:tRNA pseudouridine32 synthase/23S rRNA pseudouridine746 synthase